MGTETRDSQPPEERTLDWRAWLPGLAVLVVVVVVSLRFSEVREFVRIAERARPLWLLASVGLQTLTYAAQGAVFRAVAKSRHFELGFPAAYRLSLIKLFVDQAFPSAGLSGTVAAARELRHTSMPRELIATSVVVSIVSYQFAYAFVVVAALPIIGAHRSANTLVIVGSIVFATSVSAWGAIVLWLSKRASGISHSVSRVRPLRALFEFVQDADPALTHDARLLLRAIGCQLAIISLDTATTWTLLRSLGEAAPPDVVFASFVLASILRAIGLVPGGLGTFEAMSVLALKLGGIPVPSALAATLMFRGLSFWLPMLIGLMLYRQLRGGSARSRRSLAG